MKERAGETTACDTRTHAAPAGPSQRCRAFAAIRSIGLIIGTALMHLKQQHRQHLEELARTAQLPDLAHLIRREDLPRTPQRLPRPLTAEQDRLLQQKLLRRNDLPANVFLLLRHTGMRIGECADLSYDCLHHVGPHRWAISRTSRQAEDGTNGPGGLVCL